MSTSESRTPSSNRSLLSSPFVAEDTALFHLIAGQMPDALFLIDLDDPDAPGKIVYANESACRMYGYTQADLVGRALRELTRPENVGLFQEQINLLFKNETLTFEGEYRRHDGTLFTVERHIRLLQWNGSRLAFAIDRDSSDRKRTQVALNRSESQYRALFTASERQAQELALLDRVRTILSREMDLEIVFKTIVEAVAETFGYRHIALHMFRDDQLTLKYFLGYKTTDAPISFLEEIAARVARTGEPAHLEDIPTAEKTDEADEGAVSMICTPLFDQGKVVGTLTVESLGDSRLTEADLTLMIGLSEHIGVAIGRARLYSEIQASEIRYRNLVEQLKDVIFTLNRQGVISYISPVIYEYSGYSMDELIGQPFSFLMDQQNGPALLDRVKKMIDGQISAPFEFQLSTKDRSPRWVRISSRIHTNNAGDGEILGLMTDITDRKRIEEERVKLSKLESLGVLAGGMAHDFNNLLTGILGNISIIDLSLNPEHESIRYNIREAEKALMRAKGLTSQLLTFARGGTPVKTPLNLKTLLAEITSFSLHGSNSRYEMELYEGLWPIHADLAQISQVFQNIIINADQAMSKGGIIHIHAENVLIKASGKPERIQLTDGPYVKVAITDHGPGIPPEMLPKIFDPYFTTKEGSSGLGLATAHSIVIQHGGSIVVDSTIGHGATFSLYLPSILEETETEPPAPPDSLPRSESEPTSGRILVLDDEEMILSLVEQVLTRFGYEVVVTTDGSETVSSYEQARSQGHPFDVLVLDLTIPGGKGGKEVIEEIRRVDSDVHAIVSSGYHNDPVLANYQEYGFNDRVQKPYRIQELLQVVQRTMHKTEP